MKRKYSYILISLCLLGILFAPVSPILQISNTYDLGLSINKSVVYAEDPPKEKTFYESLEDCGIGGIGGRVSGCLVVILYHLFVTIPAWLMITSAKLFDFAVTLTLSDTMYRAPFIEKIWHIVRDFANIFFILILLYAAFQIIFGNGGGKKMVASVLLIALLVNFSLFFTRVVVDSSNVLGLIFYNKILVDKKINSPPTSDESKTHIEEKPVSSLLVANFNINKIFDPKYLTELKSNGGGGASGSTWLIVIGAVVLTFFTFGAGAAVGAGLIGGGVLGGASGGHLNTEVAVSLIAVYAIIALSIAWAFFTVGISFIGRLITLMMLMIISPLAFVTVAVPKLRDKEFIGFNSWLSELLKTSFVVAIFMAILYIITEIVRANIFTSFSNDYRDMSSYQRILILIVPALVVVIFLRKGAKYAKEASGAITEHIMKGAKMVLGAGVGAGATVVARVGRQTIGRGAAAFKAGGSRIAGTGLGKFAQKVPFFRGMRQFGTFNWVRKPGQTERDAQPGASSNKDIKQGPVPLTTKEPIASPLKQETKQESSKRTVVTGFQTKTQMEEQEKREKEQAAAEAQARPTPPPPLASARTLKDRVADGQFFAKQQYKAADFLSKSSFDFRGTKMAKMLGKWTGMDFGTPAGKGGYEAWAKKQKDDKIALAKELMPSGAELSALHSLHSDMLDLEHILTTPGGNTQQNRDAYDVARQLYDAENARIGGIRRRRKMSFAQTADRGYGVDFIMSRMGLYAPANLAAGRYIRHPDHTREIEGTYDPNPETQAIVNAIRGMGTGGGHP